MFRRIFLPLGLAVGGLVLAALVGAVVYVYSTTRDLPSVEALKNYQPPVTTRVYAGNGTLLGEYARERRIFVPIAFVPKLVVNAFTSAEDKNFFRHPGIDPSGILRAALKDVVNVSSTSVSKAPRRLRSRSRRTSCSMARSGSRARSRKQFSRYASMPPIRSRKSSNSI